MSNSVISYIGFKLTNWNTVYSEFVIDGKPYTFEFDKSLFDKFENLYYSLYNKKIYPDRKLFAFAKKHNIYGKFSKGTSMNAATWLMNFRKREDLVRFCRIINDEVVIVHHVSDDVDVTGIQMDIFPVKMGTVLGTGSFLCSHTGLKSFVNCPERIYGHFECDCNKISDLAGIPKYVGGNFSMKVNRYDITEEQIRKVCEVKGEVYL